MATTPDTTFGVWALAQLILREEDFVFRVSDRLNYGRADGQPVFLLLGQSRGYAHDQKSLLQVARHDAVFLHKPVQAGHVTLSVPSVESPKYSESLQSQ